MASIFEAMGGYESAPVEEDQPAKPKRRRVEERTLRLTQQQWHILEALVISGSTLMPVAKTQLYELRWPDGAAEYHSRVTISSLVKRDLMRIFLPHACQITDAGRHALRIREENKPGQL